MKKSDFQAMLKSQLNTLLELTATKGEEYSRSDDDQLANFKRWAADAGITPQQVLMIMLNKHLDAIKSHAKSGKVLSEPIYGRISDAILYLLLYNAMVIDIEAMAAAASIDIEAMAAAAASWEFKPALEGGPYVDPQAAHDAQLARRLAEDRVGEVGNYRIE